MGRDGPVRAGYFTCVATTGKLWHCGIQIVDCDVQIIVTTRNNSLQIPKGPLGSSAPE